MQQAKGVFFSLVGNVSGRNRITYTNLETLNQDHMMLIQGAQED
jgi:hypothetical protein